MPLVAGRKDSGFQGKLRLKRLSPPLLRNVMFWEYEQPYRLGSARILHIPGLRTGWIRGRWDDRSVKDPDNHLLIQQHLLDAMQGRVRGYFAGENGNIHPVGGDQPVP